MGQAAGVPTARSPAGKPCNTKPACVGCFLAQSAPAMPDSLACSHDSIRLPLLALQRRTLCWLMRRQRQTAQRSGRATVLLRAAAAGSRHHVHMEGVPAAAAAASAAAAAAVLLQLLRHTLLSLRPAVRRLAEGGEGGADDEVHPGEEEEEEEEQAFAPERGNVVFGSAYDGWAFRINQFADMYAGGCAALCCATLCCAALRCAGACSGGLRCGPLLLDVRPALRRGCAAGACGFLGDCLPLLRLAHYAFLPHIERLLMHACSPLPVPTHRSQDGLQGVGAAARAVGRLCLPAQDEADRSHQGKGPKATCSSRRD